MLPSDLPPEPDDVALPRARGRVPLRYEDIAQNGRLMLRTLPAVVGEVIWTQLLKDHAVTEAMRSRGIFAILTRLVFEGGAGPVAVRGPCEGEGTFALAHSLGPEGTPNRLYLNMWASLAAPRGRTHGPPPPRAGERIVLGRIFAEHVFSKIFAPPAERRVVRFEGLRGLPDVPPLRYEPEPPEVLLAPPRGATPLEEALVPDGAPIVFGLGHTDSNQHVNSLVYPRLFEDAAVRRLDTLGHGTASLMPVRAEVAYRKPCFAGERYRLELRAFALDGGALGIAGGLVPDASPPLGAPGAARPHCCARIVLAPVAD